MKCLQVQKFVLLERRAVLSTSPFRRLVPYDIHQRCYIQHICRKILCLVRYSPDETESIICLEELRISFVASSAVEIRSSPSTRAAGAVIVVAQLLDTGSAGKHFVSQTPS